MDKGTPKRSRKTMEKERRNNMKNLYSQLNSLIPNQDPSRPLPDQLDEATNYIKQLQGNVENLRQTRDGMMGVGGSQGSSSTRPGYSSNSSVQIEVNENGSALEVTLVTGLECQFVFTEAVRILHEENAEVVNASYSVAENTVFHTIHAQIGEAATSDAGARITRRLKNFEI
ncbi:transcription factor bHLH162-like [Beta vulgaris subsp. vulgaris]|uniref:transcription factor bHLH162-like n=1 Tax=Beta vulgaris subsp. vulgaris TaxID=3555 RepID=UPI00053FCED1|nr:transcription factor bHLH162-like [Beta vulgaris subsp. vulgaris]